MHIFNVRDPDCGDRFLVDMVLPRAAQKGTGHWTVEASLTYAAPAPTITAALLTRYLSEGTNLLGLSTLPRWSPRKNGFEFVRSSLHDFAPLGPSLWGCDVVQNTSLFHNARVHRFVQFLLRGKHSRVCWSGRGKCGRVTWLHHGGH